MWPSVASTQRLHGVYATPVLALTHLSVDGRHRFVTATFEHASFVNRLDEHRQSLGLSWRQVAAATGLEPSTLQRIIAGSVPDLARFAALIDWMGASADEFITREQTSISIRLPAGQQIDLLHTGGVPLTAKQLRHLRAALSSMIQALDS